MARHRAARKSRNCGSSRRCSGVQPILVVHKAHEVSKAREQSSEAEVVNHVEQSAFRGIQKGCINREAPRQLLSEEIQVIHQKCVNRPMKKPDCLCRLGCLSIANSVVPDAFVSQGGPGEVMTPARRSRRCAHRRV